MRPAELSAVYRIGQVRGQAVAPEHPAKRGAEQHPQDVGSARRRNEGGSSGDLFRPVHTQMSAEPSVDELIRRIPSSLFKYSAISGERLEWMRRLIVDSELYFTPPRFFNDPLDFQITPSFDADPRQNSSR